MKLTIIIPVYNKKNYLANILQQVREQSFSDYECLLIDDGSTDGSGEICDEFSQEDARFRAFHIPNGGVSHARNVGLDAAMGEYVTFIDADDGIRSWHLENLVRCVEESGADLVISGFDKITDDGVTVKKVRPRKPGTWKFIELLSDFGEEQQSSGIFGYCFGKIFRRLDFKDVRFDETLKLAEDLDFYLNFYSRIDTVHLDDQASYMYLLDADNSTGNIASDNIDYLAQLNINLHYRDVLRKRGAYIGMNREMVDKRLADYAYFALFHAQLSGYKALFEQLFTICGKEQIPLHGDTILKKWLLFCLQQRLYNLAKGTMVVYRAARWIRNGVK